jgi:methyltransferase (TIGR00027 family)
MSGREAQPWPAFFIRRREKGMRRRTFLRGVVVSALTVSHARAWAQGVAPSRLSEGTPSRTAQATANLRAAHQLLDQPRIFDDSLALRIIGVQAEAAVRANLGRSPIATFRPFVAVRSRYAEDELAHAVQRGVRQYALLGAGLDTFAYRNPYPVSRLRVFEVDHPATQVWKRARLQEAGIAIPESLTFAAIDFERETLAGGLRQAGFKTDEPAFVSMLGVVVYLTRDAAMSTLKFVASLPSGTEIVFDYAIAPSALSESDRRVHDDTTRVVAARGEPWLSYFAPPTLAADLRGAGFTSVEDLGPDEIRERYLKDRTDGLRVNGLARLVKAGR